MRAIFIFALIALLAMPAMAKHEEISAGPYNVSFDLNTSSNYSIMLHPESIDNDSSSYLFEVLFDNDTRAAVGIVKYNNWQCADFPCSFWQNLYLSNDPNIKSFSILYPLIDGKAGQVISTEAPRIKDNKIVNSTEVEVWTDSKKIEGYDFLIGKTKVEMILLLPDNLTRDMLNTFHLVDAGMKLGTMAAEDQSTSISVRTQTNKDPDGIVIIPQVVSNGPSYVVVFDEFDNVLGYNAVSDGVNNDVQVSLNQTPQSQWLYATLNGVEDTSTEYWQYPFDPDAIVNSSKFFDSRVRAISDSGSLSQSGSTAPTGTVYQTWLDFEGSTSKTSPDYDRYECIKTMTSHGYPPDLAAFYCD